MVGHKVHPARSPKAMNANEFEYAVIFHHTCPQNRQSELVLERIRKRFDLNGDNLTILAQGTPVVVKRHSELLVAKNLQKLLNCLGAVAWVQKVYRGAEYRDRRAEKRRQVPDRRSAYRHTLSVPERRFGGGRRRTDIGITGREYWRGLVV